MNDERTAQQKIEEIKAAEKKSKTIRRHTNNRVMRLNAQTADSSPFHLDDRHAGQPFRLVRV
jgi:hypothetical protein